MTWQYIRSVFISYFVFAVLLSLGRFTLTWDILNILPQGSWSWLGTLFILVGSMLFSLAMFGPAVITVLWVRHLMPGRDWQTLLIMWVPATALAALVAPLFWWIMFGIDINLFETLFTSGIGLLFSAVYWLLGVLLVLVFDRWIRTPKKSIPNKPSTTKGLDY